MKRQIFAIVAAVLLMSTPSWTMQSPKSKAPKPPKSPQLTVSKPVKSTTTTTKVKPVSAKATTTKAKAVKPAKTTAVKPVKSETKAAKPVKTTKVAKADKKSTTTTASTEVPKTTTEPGPGTTTTLSPVQQKLQRNKNLASKLEGRLQGLDLMEAAKGFTSLGKFVSAVNVSYNHQGIEFEALKTLILDEGYSLGQAIQKLKSELNGPVEARRAETEAQRLITSTDPSGNTIVSTAPTTTAPTTTTTAKKKKPVGGQQ